MNDSKKTATTFVSTKKSNAYLNMLLSTAPKKGLSGFFG
jgi:hypothetical protein